MELKMSEKIFLGTVRDGIEGMNISGENLYIEKHSFDRDWYWSFGYIGNKDVHMHFSELLYPDTKKSGYNVYNASELFKRPYYSDEDWWIIRDLFVQAYALGKAAEVYKCSGRQTSKPETRIILSYDMHKRINADLEKVLDSIWEILTTRRLK